LFKRENINIYIGYLAIVYAFILPLSRAGIGIVGALMLILWIIDGNFKAKLSRYLDNRVTRYLIIFISLVFISLLWTKIENIKIALDIDRRYWYLFPLFIFFTTLPKEYLSKVLSAFILGMFVSEIIAYGVFFDLWEFGRATKSDPSPFIYHTEYSVFLAITSLILLNKIFYQNNLKVKFFYTIFFLTVTGNLFLTNGRTGQLAFLFGLFTLSIISFKNRLQALIIFLLISTMVFTAGFNFSKTFHNRIILAKVNLFNSVKKQDYCTSVGNRIGAYIVAWDIIKKNPIFGVGYQDNMDKFREIVKDKYPLMKCMYYLPHFHNQFLQIWTGGGVISLIAFLFIFYYLYKLPIKNVEWSNIRYIFLSINLMSFIPELPWGVQFSLSLTALFIGLILAQYRAENE